jgi:hypothetical protein
METIQPAGVLHVQRLPAIELDLWWLDTEGGFKPVALLPGFEYASVAATSHVC